MRGLFYIIFLLAISCQTSEGVRFATDTTYYLQITDEENSERSSGFVDRLYSEIPVYKYTITHESGPKGWPFYESFDLKAKMPVDSIMPPHLIFHAFEVYEVDEEVDPGSYLVKATILEPSEDGATVLKFQMYERKESEWVRVVDLKDHPFVTTKYPTQDDQYRILKETIIRSSFK